MSIPIWGYINFEFHGFNLRLNAHMDLITEPENRFAISFLILFPPKSVHSDKHIDSKFWKTLYL